MKRVLFLLFTLSISNATKAQAPQSPGPQTVEISSGGFLLKAFLWKPAGTGPFPAVLFNHGRSNTPQQHTQELTITEAAQVLGPVFVKHGYVFLFLFRRGKGLSADQGQFIGSLLDREEAAKGKEARNRLQLLLMVTDHLGDSTAGLSFLKTLPYVDSHCIAVAGHSFGGQLTLLQAANDKTLRAAVAFSPGANSWNNLPEHRERLMDAVRKLSVPIIFFKLPTTLGLADRSEWADVRFTARRVAPYHIVSVTLSTHS